MPQEAALIPDLIRQTLADPRGAAQRIIGMELPAGVLWQGLALVVLLSVITAQVTTLLMKAGGGVSPEATMMGEFFTNPLLMTFVQGAILVIMVFAVHWIGRSLGGWGRFEGAIAIVAWLQFLLVCLQVVQTFVGFVSPALSGLIGLAGVVFFFWLLTQFIMVLHGFQSAGMVFVMIVVSILSVTFAISILLTILGILVVGEPPDV